MKRIIAAVGVQGGEVRGGEGRRVKTSTASLAQFPVSDCVLTDAAVHSQFVQLEVIWVQNQQRRLERGLQSTQGHSRVKEGTAATMATCLTPPPSSVRPHLGELDQISDTRPCPGRRGGLVAGTCKEGAGGAGGAG